MRIRHLGSVAALLLALAAACADSTGPGTLDVAGVEADLGAATAAASAPATASVAALGGLIDAALADLGGGAALIDLPAAMIGDPAALFKREELRSRAREDLGRPAVIPAVALGKTFEFDVVADRYVMGERAGAPANGVRFILYEVDPLDRIPVEPLVEVGYVDLTRSVSQQVATARVEAYGGGNTPVKVLDYAVTLQGTILSPIVIVSGFAKNGADSLAFALMSTISIDAQTVAIDWSAAVPAQGFASHVEVTLTGGQASQMALDGMLASPNGRVRIAGTVLEATGGALTVSVNGDTFATIELDSAADETPTILNAAGQPLTDAQREMLEHILEWFDDAVDLYEDLLDPVETLLDIAF